MDADPTGLPDDPTALPDDPTGLPEPAEASDPTGLPAEDHLEAVGAGALEELPTGAEVISVGLEDLEEFELIDPTGGGTYEGSLSVLGDDELRAEGESALVEGLRRSRGPFGPRDAAWRLLLLPHADYKGKAHFLRHRVAEVTGRDLYDAAQCLQRVVPSFLRAGEDRDALSDQAQHLREGGLDVIVVGRDSFDRSILPVGVRAGEARGRYEVALETWSGDYVTVDRRTTRSAWVGEIQLDRDEVRLAQDRGRAVEDLRPTYDAGGRPYTLVDIARTEGLPPLRLRVDQFDFSCLGKEKTLAARVNVNKLLLWLSPSEGPFLKLDDRFKRVPHLPASSPLMDGDAMAAPQREIEFTEFVLLMGASRADG